MLKAVVQWITFAAVLIAPLAAPTRAQSRADAPSGNLDIYWVDVEGGAATLLIAPSGESLLVDAGWETGGRDARRIFEVAQQAGLKRIDYFVLSHFHADHEGGLPALAKLIPIGRCFDRGDFIEPANQRWRDAYLGVCGDRRTIVKVGDQVPLKGVQTDIVASDGQLLAKPMNGGRPNPLCATAENKPRDVPENYRMVGALFTFGKFRFLDLADLDWAMEMELACPVNKLGEVTLYQTGRHGALRRRGRARISLRDQAAGRDREQRTAEGPGRAVSRSAEGRHGALRADCEVAGHRRDLAGAPLAIRQGTQHQRSDDREPRGHRGVPGPLDQSLGGIGWEVHGHQRPERRQQDLSGSLTLRRRGRQRQRRAALSGRLPTVAVWLCSFPRLREC